MISLFINLYLQKQISHLMSEGYISYLTERAAKYLYKTANWSSFFAILGYITAIIYLVVGLGFLIGGSLANYFGGLQQLNTTVIGLVYIPISGLAFWCSFQLKRFSSKAKLALKTNNEKLLEEALNAQNWAYAILGVSTVVSLLLIIASLFAVIIGGITGLIG